MSRMILILSLLLFLPGGVSLAEQPNSPAGARLELSSIAAFDGWIREKRATSGRGGRYNTRSRREGLRVGDNGRGEQFRSIVSFDTARIPAGARIRSAKLHLKESALRGTPYELGKFVLATRSGSFGERAKVELHDFEAKADVREFAQSSRDYQTGWVSLSLGEKALSAINREGLTQLRLGFRKKSDGDRENDFVAFYSAECETPGNRPVLEVEYTPEYQQLWLSHGSTPLRGDVYR